MPTPIQALCKCGSDDAFLIEDRDTSKLVRCQVCKNVYAVGG